MAEHLLPNPMKALYENSGWSKFRDFQEKMELVYRDNHEKLDVLHDSLIAEMKQSNAAAVAAAKADPDNAAAVLAAAGQKATTDTLNALQSFAAENFDEVTIQGTPRIDMYNAEATVDIVFTAPKGGVPTEESIRFGLGMLNARTTYIAPVAGSLKPVNESDGEYQVTFKVADLISKVGRYTRADGKYDYFLAGETEDGTCFTGMVLADVLIQTRATVSLTGPADVTVEQEKLTYTVSVEDAENLATATVELAVDNLVDPVAAPAEGWYLLASSYEDGVLTAVVCNNAGVTGEADILTVTGGNPGKVGTATVALNSAVLSAFQGNGETFVTVVYGETTVETVIDYSVYDVNQDGTVNQLDITRAQRAYGASEGDANWNALADVDGNGTVDIADLILILNNYSR